MKYHILLKFIAIVLCACALAACAGSALGILVLEEHGLYKDITPEQIYSEQMGYTISTYAHFLTIRYAGKTLGGCPDDLINHYLQNNFSYSTLATQDNWYYILEDANGITLESRYDAEAIADAQQFTCTSIPTYPTVIGHSQDRTDFDTPLDVTTPTVPDSFIPDTHMPAPEDSDYLYIDNYFFQDNLGISHRYQLGMTRGPAYHVTFFLTADALETEDAWLWQLLKLGYEFRYGLIGLLLGSLLIFGLCATYLSV